MNEAMTSSPEAPPGWGRPVLLRQAREAAGLHIAALAAALKVPVKKLEALEAGRYDELPDMTFARALASSACRHLKIDPAPVLEQIPLGQTAVLGDPSHGINAPFKPPREGAAFRPLDWLRRPAVLASLALVLAAAGLMYLPDLRPWCASATAVASGLFERSPEVAAEEAASSEGAALPAAEPPAAASADKQGAPGPALAAEAATAPAPAEMGSDGVLSIKARGDSWVEVVDGAGVSQVQRMLKAGDALSFTTAPPFAVVLGRADSVEVTVRGQPFDVMPFARNSVARFQVK